MDVIIKLLATLDDSVRLLNQTAQRLAVLSERQLASGQAVQRRAEKVLHGIDPVEIENMRRTLRKKLGR